MKDQIWKCRIVEAIILLFVIGCSREKPIRSTEEGVTLASSVFYHGELAAGGAGPGGSDTGNIPTPGSGSGTGDQGNIAVPAGGGSGGTTDDGSTGGGSGSGGASGGGGSGVGTNDTSSGAPLGSTSGGGPDTSGTPTSGGTGTGASSDTGNIGTGSGTVGVDTGNVGGGTSVGTTGGSTSAGSDSGGAGPGISSGTGSTGEGTSTNGSSSSGGSATATGTSGGSGDTGSIASGSGTTSSTDTGNIGTGGSSGGDGGSVSGNTGSGGSGSGSGIGSGLTQATGSGTGSSNGTSGTGGNVNTGSDSGQIASGGTSGTGGGSDSGLIGDAGSGNNAGQAGGGTLLDKIKDLITKLKDDITGLMASITNLIANVTGNTPQDGTNSVNPNSGSDTGNIGNGNGGKGKDGGNIGNNTHPFSFSLGRVCSVRRSQSDRLFFEEADQPILSLEASYDPNCAGGRDYWAGPGVVPVKCGYYNVKPYVGKNAMLVGTIDLSAANLLKERYSAEFRADLSGLKAKYPEIWEDMMVDAVVCDDTNRDGGCSDEATKNILSIRTFLFRAKRFPKRLALDVWSGRNRTLQGNPELCEKQYSPIVLDLNGDGISLTGPENGVRFDLNDDDQLEYTGWVTGKDDAFLVRDLNGNGRIDSGAELFGSATRLKSGKRSLNGFEALKDLDDNGDGLFTRKDSAWRSIRLWIDKNADGMSERGELFTLKRAQIVSINLNYVEMMEVDSYGNQTRQRSTFVRRAGEGETIAGLIVDIWFSTLVQ